MDTGHKVLAYEGEVLVKGKKTRNAIQMIDNLDIDFKIF